MTELETSRELSRAEVAAYLREFADELDRRSDDGTMQQHESGTHAAGHTDQTTGHTDQTTGHTDQTTGHTDQTTGHTDHTAGHTDHATETSPDSARTPTDTETSGPTDTSTTTEDNTAETAEATTDQTITDEATNTTTEDGRRTHSNADYRKVTFLVGNDSATINPPEIVSFDVAVDSDSALMEARTRERVDFSIAWNADDVPEDDELRIE